MNKVILMGRLTSDPKMDWTRSEDSKQYATYTLAVNPVEGRLNVRSWEKDGERHWTTTVVVENCYFTGSKRDAESKPAQSKPAAQTGKQMGLAEQEGFYPIDETVEDDDLPF